MADTQPLAPKGAPALAAALSLLIREAQGVADDHHRPRYTRLDDALTSARAVLAKWGAQPVVPAGYALVPVEATEDMKAAAVKYANGTAVYKNVSAEVLRIEEGIYGEVYEAMLAAAPQPVVREPLTDEQIRELWSTRSLHALEFARAIESANGISPAQEAN